MDKADSANVSSAWRTLHPDVADREVDANFEAGYKAACDHLLPLLRAAEPHVYGSCGAAHMMDGFKKKPHPIDNLLADIRAASKNYNAS